MPCQCFLQAHARIDPTTEQLIGEIRYASTSATGWPMQWLIEKVQVLPHYVRVIKTQTFRTYTRCTCYSFVIAYMTQSFYNCVAGACGSDMVWEFTGASGSDTAREFTRACCSDTAQVIIHFLLMLKVYSRVAGNGHCMLFYRAWICSLKVIGN